MWEKQLWVRMSLSHSCQGLPSRKVCSISVGGSAHFEARRRFPAGIDFQWDALKDVFASFKCPVRINVPLPVQALYKVSDLSSSDCPWQHEAVVVVNPHKQSSWEEKKGRGDCKGAGEEKREIKRRQTKKSLVAS